MHWLAELVAGGREELVRRVHDFARDERLARLTTATPEPWRPAVAGVLDALLVTLARNPGPVSWVPDVPADPGDPLRAFAMAESARHRARGVSLPLFLGLVKDIRRAFHDLVEVAGRDGDEARTGHAWLDAFFDTLELTACAEWSRLDQPDLVAGIQEVNQSLQRQVIRWRELFDGLPEPVLLLDVDASLLAMNQAAVRTFLGEAASGLDRCGLPLAEAIPALAPLGADLRAAGNGESRGARSLRAVGGPRDFVVHVGPLRAPGGRPQGTLVVLRDETEHRRAQRGLMESRHHLDEVMEATTDSVFMLDANWRFTYLNGRAADALRSDAAALMGASIWDAFADARGTRLEQEFRRCLGAKVAAHFEDFYPVFGAWFECHAYPLRGGLTVFFRDVTARHEAQEALRRSEERYALVAQGANDALWDYDLQSRSWYCSPRLYELLGLPPGSIEDPLTESVARLHMGDRDDVLRTIRENLERHVASFEVEFRLLHGKGGWVWVLGRTVVVRGPGGDPVRFVGSLSDITARRQSEEQLEHQALHDSLTGLPNRALFLDRLAQAISVARRRPWFHYAALFLDLDRFKNVNDSLGHPAGDELLKTVARRIAECLRPGDTVARVGGDEFAVLLNDLRDIPDAEQVGQRILAHVATSVTVMGQEFVPNVSIGIAHSGMEYESAEDVLRDSDTAMYRAKGTGRGRLVVFDRQMHRDVSQRVQVESELRRAVEAGEFVVFYQPIVSLKARRITGFEALVRWAHPERGIRSPADFIQVAEETGLIVPIGGMVLRAACRQAAAWGAGRSPEERPTVSVNFSVRQFTGGSAVPDVQAALRESELPARCLKVEITESLLMEDSGDILRQLEELRAMGVQLQMDDFGTGYSSLAYLHRFPIDTIKVDRSFVSGVHSGVRGEVVRTIVTLARTLEMETIAEGVETAEQLHRLCELECGSAQGYLFSRPVDGAAATGLLEAGVRWPA